MSNQEIYDLYISLWEEWINWADRLSKVNEITNMSFDTRIQLRNFIRSHKRRQGYYNNNSVGSEMEHTGIKKVITIADFHYPFNVNPETMFQYIKDEQPDEIVFLGDAIDMHGVSTYYEGGVEQWCYDTYDEIQGFKNDVLKRIKRLSKRTRIVFMDGNHEDRVWNQIKEKKARGRLIDHWKLLSNYVDHYVKYNDVYKIGHLYFTHGVYHNDSHAKKHAIEFMKNMRYGHIHTVQEYAKSSPVGDRTYTAKSLPCMCDLNPEYMRKRPNSWMNGFNIAFFQENGDFNDYNIIITDWKFIAPNGKLYS